MRATRELRGTIAAGAVASLLGAAVAADDTEVFRFTPPPDVRPNVLFIIDDSLSMGAAVLTQTAYDATVIYASQGCDATRVYWTKGSGTPPSCTTNDWFNASAQKCARAAQAFAAAGRFWDDHLAQYDPSGSGTWRDLAPSEKDRVVECEDDQGTHGDGGAGRFAADNVAPDAWHASSANEIDWRAREEATIFSGNYLNWYYGPSQPRTRLDVVQTVVDDLLETLDGVNVGLMSFNPVAGAAGSDGGSISVAVADVATNRTALRAAVAALTPSAGTPLAETLFEARQYFAGNDVTFGSASVAAARVAGNASRYDSPVEEPCQQNFVVLLTDGEPTGDNEADEDILAMRDAENASFGELTGGAVCDVEAWSGLELAAPPSGEMSHCLDDVAHFLYEGDISSAHAGKQRVRTVTVGFTVDLPVLESAAQRGNGRAPGDSEGVYFAANDAASLVSAFSEIVTGVQRTAASFTAPAVPVDAFNRAQSSNDLLVGVFEPSPDFHWPGNLKKYRLRDDGAIVDARNAAAVDSVTGLFVDGTQSYWSATLDGADVTKGGAASLIPAPRLVYSNLSGSVRLSDPANRVSLANTGITDEMLALGATTWTRDDVIGFINGFDPASGRQRGQMGDPLHSQPVPVLYGPGPHDGLVFVATNDGFLHAFDAATGIEQWAFLPREFLAAQVELLDNNPFPAKHSAVDGPIRVQTVEPGKRVYLFVGMRRGGRFYYGLDISDRADPRLLWRRDGAHWSGLGETWSPPAPTRVKIGSTEHVALVVGGGYENDQDNDESTTDVTGNSIYIVDSATGNVLWRGGIDAGATKRFDAPGRSMSYSFPAEIKVVDLDGNGLMDRLYAADMGGQVWRFDVTNGAAAAELVVGGVIAQLGAAGDATPTLAENRRFYYSPDVAVVNTRLASFTHVGLGSGHREHPLGVVNEDRFYALRDKNVGHMTQAQFDALSIVNDGDFVPVTTTTTTISPAAAGWRLDLLPGEKVLAEARTIANEVFFTTFRPGVASGPCEPPPGISRLYRLSLYNGAPVANLDASAATDALTMSDLFVEHLGLPSSAASQVIFIPRDRDEDGIPDKDDMDDDGDSVPDAADDDADNDGLAGEADPDDDNDGVMDPDEPVGEQGWVCTDRLCVPLGFTNSPVRTYWRQTNPAGGE